MSIPPFRNQGGYHLVYEKILGVAGTVGSRFCGANQAYIEAEKLTL